MAQKQKIHTSKASSLLSSGATHASLSHLPRFSLRRRLLHGGPPRARCWSTAPAATQRLLERLLRLPERGIVSQSMRRSPEVMSVQEMAHSQYWDQEVIQWLSPLFDLLGKATWMGLPGSGQSSKIAYQIAVAGSVAGTTEGILFARKMGLDVGAFLKAIGRGQPGRKSREDGDAGLGNCSREDECDRVELQRPQTESLILLVLVWLLVWLCITVLLCQHIVSKKG